MNISIRNARVAATALGLFLAATATGSSRADARQTPPSLPDASPPPGATVVRAVQAGGVQVYVCNTTAAGTFAWKLIGPKALLVNDDGSDFGTHSAGPTWTAIDGSSIVGDGAHPLAKVERPNSVPGLVLTVSGSSGNGVLTGVRFVRRSDTEGGVAPEGGCDAAHVDAQSARHYSAVYTFYR